MPVLKMSDPISERLRYAVSQRIILLNDDEESDQKGTYTLCRLTEDGSMRTHIDGLTLEQAKELLDKEYPNQVFLDPETKHSWRVMFNNRVCSPDFNSRGAAVAYLYMLEQGTRQPEYSV